jgi:hypothetical protein
MRDGLSVVERGKDSSGIEPGAADQDLIKRSDQMAGHNVMLRPGLIKAKAAPAQADNRPVRKRRPKDQRMREVRTNH